MSDTAAAAPPVRSIGLGDLEQELEQTRRLLTALPAEHYGFKPHEKSMSAGGLAQHIAQIPYWVIRILQEDHFDLAAAGPRLPEPATQEEVLARFDENVAAVRAALEGTDDAAMLRPWTLRRGDHVVFQLPRLAALRTVGVSHLIHHRGQLTVYLRLLDLPVPGMYGPSADEAAF